jgi:hypothetical protein
VRDSWLVSVTVEHGRGLLPTQSTRLRVGGTLLQSSGLARSPGAGGAGGALVAGAVATAPPAPRS